MFAARKRRYGWRGDSYRHGLARRGVRSAWSVGKTGVRVKDMRTLFPVGYLAKKTVKFRFARVKERQGVKPSKEELAGVQPGSSVRLYIKSGQSPSVVEPVSVKVTGVRGRRLRGELQSMPRFVYVAPGKLVSFRRQNIAAVA